MLSPKPLKRVLSLHRVSPYVLPLYLNGMADVDLFFANLLAALLLCFVTNFPPSANTQATIIRSATNSTRKRQRTPNHPKSASTCAPREPPSPVESKADKKVRKCVSVTQIISINCVPFVCSQRERERRARTRLLRVSPPSHSPSATSSERYLSHDITPAKKRKHVNLGTVNFPDLVAPDGECLAEN